MKKMAALMLVDDFSILNASSIQTIIIDDSKKSSADLGIKCLLSILMQINSHWNVSNLKVTPFLDNF